MRNRPGRLQQDQAASRIGGDDAASPRLPGDHQEIGLRVVTPQRQLEAVLSRRRAVAGARVAAGFGQHRLHVVAEAPGRIAFVLLDRDRHAGRAALPACPNDGLAVGDGDGDRIADPHDLRIARLENDIPRHLAAGLSPFNAFDNERLPRLRPAKNDRSGQDGQRIAFPGGRSARWPKPARMRPPAEPLRRGRRNAAGETLSIEPDMRSHGNHRLSAEPAGERATTAANRTRHRGGVDSANRGNCSDCVAGQNSSVIGLVPESTKANGRPAGPGRVVSRSKPKLWKIVATTSFGAMGRSAG